VNFIIVLETVTESSITMKFERLVIAETKDEAYDKYFAHPFIRNAIAKSHSFAVTLRQIEMVE